MIRVLKDLKSIPASLAVPPSSGPARTTHHARQRIISESRLLFACPFCNQYKGDNFRINGTVANYDPDHLDTINTISIIYDEVEKPDFINPEREDPENLLNFREDGFIDSSDSRCQYTIATCKIDRPNLNDSRKKVWDDFIKDLTSEIFEGTTKEEILSSVSVLIRKFNRDAENASGNEFLAFRRFAIRNWLSSKIKELTT
ncbi:MAG TPA: hypothetical protein PKE06_17380 [Flavilitoribacter sp.]|nr:hypothetical protein [Flavilitoribacter sp.]HMQ88314.1 hypothetical protein [Flavilitoribacter sp.]